VLYAGSGGYRAAGPFTGQAKFFRLAAGEHFVDLFDRTWDTIPRITTSLVRGQSGVPGFTRSAGGERIQRTGARNADFLFFYDFGFPAKGDILASVDIVDWDERMEDSAFGIVVRANPGKEF
jgi:hypothetical protein